MALWATPTTLNPPFQISRSATATLLYPPWVSSSEPPTEMYTKIGYTNDHFYTLSGSLRRERHCKPYNCTYPHFAPPYFPNSASLAMLLPTAYSWSERRLYKVKNCPCNWRRRLRRLLRHHECLLCTSLITCEQRGSR